MKNKIVTFLLFFLFSIIEIYSCQCKQTSLNQTFMGASFVAEIKILKKYANEKDNEYYKVDIEVLNIYKGNKVESIYIYGNYEYPGDSACWIFVEEQQRLLIYAGKINKNEISLNMCSRIIFMAPPKKTVLSYDNVTYKSKERLKGEKEILQVLKDNCINYRHGRVVNFNFFRNANIILNDDLNVKLNNHFAIYEFEVGKKLKIKKVKTIFGFGKKIDKLIKKEFKKVRYSKSFAKKNNISKNKKFIVIVYYIERKYENKIYKRLYTR